MPSLQVGDDSVTISGTTLDEIEPFATLIRNLKVVAQECTVGNDGLPGLTISCRQFPRAADLVDFLFALIPLSLARP